MRVRNVFDPASAEPYRLSRSKLETFLRCARCFYLDRRLGIEQPSIPPYTLNNAVDALMKREFDAYRAKGKPHPLMLTYGVEAIPLVHPFLDTWRDYLRGIDAVHAPTNFHFFGAVDDVWKAPDGELIIVDYKATSSSAPVTLEGIWKDGYKRQLEMYQWLFRKNGFKVSSRGYFVYVNADKERPAFDRRLEFSMDLLPYEGNDDWVEEALIAARECLSGGLPPAGKGCDWCEYRKEAHTAEVSLLHPAS